MRSITIALLVLVALASAMVPPATAGGTGSAQTETPALVLSRATVLRDYKSNTNQLLTCNCMPRGDLGEIYADKFRGTYIVAVVYPPKKGGAPSYPFYVFNPGSQEFHLRGWLADYTWESFRHEPYHTVIERAMTHLVEPTPTPTPDAFRPAEERQPFSLGLRLPPTPTVAPTHTPAPTPTPYPAPQTARRIAAFCREVGVTPMQLTALVLVAILAVLGAGAGLIRVLSTALVNQRVVGHAARVFAPRPARGAQNGATS